MRRSGLELHLDDRVLVLGASGWFGQTFLDLLPEGADVLAVASSARERFVAWDDDAVRAFAPTVVANFAFLTRERVASDGEARFRETNAELTRQFLLAAELPSVRAALTVSSGAAVTEPDMPYGEMKAAEEASALALASPSHAIVVARAYSVSGAHVRRPKDYAFSDLILQAASGAVTITADRPVFRRYVSVDDFLYVGMTRALSGWSGVIDSGGELVEMGELAQRVVDIVNPAAPISRVALTSDEPSVYASDGATWQQACAALDFTPAPLDAQIRATAAGLGVIRP